MASQIVSWSSLRSDLLSNIAKRLDNRLDVLRFRAVCYSWRSSIPPPPKPTPFVKLPFPISPNSSFDPNHFLLTESTVYAFEPLTKILKHETKTWVIKIRESLKSSKLIHDEPLSGFFESLFRSAFKNLTNHFPKALNLLDYRVVELSKAYRIEFGAETLTPETKYFWIKQIAVSSSLDKLDDGFVVMALHSKGKLSVWRMGDEKWTDIDDNREKSRYDSIIFHNGKFFAIDCNGFTLTVDPTTLQISNVCPENPRAFEKDRWTKFLLNSSSDLFLVDKHKIYFKDVAFLSLSDRDEDGFYGKYFIMFRVYKFIEEMGDWVEVDELNDRAFFTCNDNSFSVSAEEFSGCKRDCLYFCDYLFSDHNDPRGYGAGIYEMEASMSQPLSRFSRYSKIFWPPPTWLKESPSMSPHSPQ